MRRLSYLKLLGLLIATVGAIETIGQQKGAAARGSLIRHVVIEPATAQTPRSDTASVAELSDGRLMVVYHRYQRGKHSGRDHGVCTIWSKVSNDGGVSWEEPRMLVDLAEGDMNVQAPALLRLKSGKLLMLCLRAHKSGGSSTMCVLASKDEGKTFSALDPVWKRSKGQLLQGGASSLVELKSGRLVLPFHGGSGNQWKQTNSAWCFLSDDRGKTWQRSTGIKLPKRGAMEASVVQLADDTLLMSLRTQLGGPYLARSADEGKTWSKAVFSGLEGGESCTCLRRIPGSKDIVLFWNNSKFNKRHHHFGGRTPLTAAISSDNGKTWRKIGNIADDPKAEYTNLDCFFTSKGDAILTYMYAKPAWNRKQIHLKAALIDRKWFARNGNTENTAERKAPQAPTIKVAFASVQRGGKPYKTFYNNYIAPHAVLENNTVFTAHQDGQGRPIVAAYDIKSKQWSAPVRASGIGLGADTHGNPSICIDSKRHLHVFFGCHGGAMKHIRSTRPYDISRWTDAPGPTHKATYPQSMRMADGSIYLFFRAGGHLAPWSMSISKDDGQTWTHRKPIIEMRHNFPDKKACSYNAFVPGADYKTVHCFWVYKDDNPRGNKRKYQKLHEAVYRYNVYYARRTAGGRWIAADGAKMSDLPVNKTFCDSHAMIFDSGEEFTAPTRIVIGKDDTPYFRIRHGVTDWKRKKVIVPYKYKFASPVEGKWGLHTEMPGQWPEQIKRLVMSAGPAAFGGRAPNEWFIHYKEGPPEDPKATYIWLGHVENGYVTPKNGPAKSPED